MTQSTGTAIDDAHNASAQRMRRAAVAQRLSTAAPDIVAAVDWDALEQAPTWLAWPDPTLTLMQRRIGALLCISQIRLWIDATRVAAARAAVGARFIQALLALPELPPLPRDVTCAPHIDTSEQVALLLQSTGASVLLASLPQGTLRRAACAAWAPSTPSAIASELASSMIARAQALSIQCDVSSDPASMPATATPERA